MKQTIRARTVTLALLLVTAGCAGMTETRTEKSSSAPLAHYKTYRWVTQDDAKTLDLSNPSTDAGAYYWVRVVNRPETTERVRNEVEKDLQSQGYSAATSSIPDFYITFFARSPDRDWLSSWNGTTPGYGNVPLIMYPDYKAADARTYRAGMAMIVIYDARSHRPVWQGSIVNAIQGQTVNRQEIALQIDKLIADFKKAA